jgi:hypothetical protein
MVIFYSYVKLPEGIPITFQMFLLHPLLMGKKGDFDKIHFSWWVKNPSVGIIIK